MVLRFGFGYEETLRMTARDLHWWYETAVELAEKEQVLLDAMGRRR